MIKGTLRKEVKTHAVCICNYGTHAVPGLTYRKEMGGRSCEFTRLVGGSLTDSHRCDGSMAHDNKSAVAGAKTDLAGVKPFVRGSVGGWGIAILGFVVQPSVGLQDCAL